MTSDYNILKGLRRLWLLGLAIWVIMFILSAGVLFMFAIAGLDELEIKSPHAFDNHRFVNYNTFGFFLNASPVIFMITMIVVVLAVACWPVNKDAQRLRS